MAEIIVFQVLGYDEDNIYLKKTLYNYEELLETEEIKEVEPLFGNKKIDSLFTRFKEEYVATGINNFFLKDDILYVIFISDTLYQNDKFLWEGDSYIESMKNEELLHNIIFDGEKHALSGSVLRTPTYIIV